MSLIERDELINRAEHWKTICKADESIRMIDAFIKGICEAKTVDAVPVEELKSIRDYLYKEDLIFMHGLSVLNKLIEKYEVSE